MTPAAVRGVWERKGFGGKSLWLLLLPAAFIYRLLAQARNALFSWGLLKSVFLPRPTVSVGNLTVGGTGKTPTTIWLSQELSRRGLKVGILSRGYGRRVRDPVVLNGISETPTAGQAEDEISRAGDEPVMMARLYGQKIAVAKNRRAAAAALLGSTDVDVFILDDGFQHRRVRRDFDLLLLGSDASGSVLPAGPFRESRRNLRRASGLLITGSRDRWHRHLPKRLGAAAFNGTLEPVALIELTANRCRELSLGLICQRKILTVTGIADPRGLYEVIHQWEGELVDTLEFPDHHCYTARDWQRINRAARRVDLIITTEKDILKLARFPFAKEKLLALRVAMAVEDGAALVDQIVEKVARSREVRQ
jgi:tetraacyldisaccharide 4'-kinase